MRSANPGDRVSEYVLDEVIGRGGFGVVWRAHHHAFPDRVVAMKIPHDATKARLLGQEGAVGDIVRHPGAVEVLGLDAEHDPPYLVLEYVEGETLADRIAREGRLPVRDVLRVACRVLDVLAFAHARGVVHRDLKPGNVLLGAGADGPVKLADFGLGRLEEMERRDLMMSGSLQSESPEALSGTLAYMAPEQREVGREIDQRADVYAFGILLFEMLTGARPEGGEVPSDLVGGLDPRLDEVFRGCYCRLEKRYPDAGAVLRVLRPVRGAYDEAFRRPALLERVSDGASVRLTERVSVGRDPGCDVVIDQPWVAPRHVEVRREGGRWFAVDQGGGSGTFLLPADAPQGKRPLDLAVRAGPEPLRIVEGVVIALGDPSSDRCSRLVFRDGEASDAVTVVREPSRLSASGAVLSLVALFAAALLARRLVAAPLALIALGLIALGAAVYGSLARVREGEAEEEADRVVGFEPAVEPPPVASPWVRLAATLLDLGLMGLFLRFAWSGWLGAPPLLWLGYEVITTSAYGATAGKWLCGLVVADASGRPIGFGRALVRSMAKLLFLVPPLCLGYLVPFVTGSSRAVHDLIADTTVVKSEPDLTG